MTSKRETAFGACFSDMPKLRHSTGEKPWTPEQSDVIRWMGANKVLLEHVFQLARQRGWVEFDPTTGTWRGAR